MNGPILYEERKNKTNFFPLRFLRKIEIENFSITGEIELISNSIQNELYSDKKLIRNME